MGTASFTIIVEGIKQLAGGGSTSGSVPHLWVVVGGTVFVVAMKLTLFLYCRRSSSAAVAAFATDHLNDVLVNTFALVGALLGGKVAWWVDPAIAIALHPRP